MHGMHKQASVSQLPAHRLRQLREQNNETLLELAVALGVNPSTVWRWERNVIPQQWMPVLAERYHVTVPYLAGWTSEKAA